MDSDPPKPLLLFGILTTSSFKSNLIKIGEWSDPRSGPNFRFFHFYSHVISNYDQIGATRDFGLRIKVGEIVSHLNHFYFIIIVRHFTVKSGRGSPLYFLPEGL